MTQGQATFNSKTKSKTFTKLLENTEIKLLIWLVFSSLLAIFIRYRLFPILTVDIKNNLMEDIINKIRNDGEISFDTLKKLDINIFYIYLVTGLSYLTAKPLIAIKMLTSFFDIFLALGVFTIIKEYTNKKTKAIIGYTATLFLPSVISSGAIWGHGESACAAFIVWMLYSILKNNSRSAVICFALAISIKFQAIFMLPLLLVWFLNQNKKNYKELLLLPGIYLILSLPALLLKINFLDLLNIYPEQINNIKTLGSGLPNLPFLVSTTLNGGGNVFYSTTQPGISTGIDSITNSFIGLSNGLAIMVFSLLIWLGWLFKPNWTWVQSIRFGLFSSLILPFLLPKMASRYYFIATIMALLYAFLAPKRFWFLFIIELISFISILVSIFNISPSAAPIPGQYLVFAIAFLICFVGFEMISGFEPFLTLQQRVAALSQKMMLKDSGSENKLLK